MLPPLNSLLIAFVAAFTVFCLKSIPGYLIYEYLAHPACLLKILAENQLFQLAANFPPPKPGKQDGITDKILSCPVAPSQQHRPCGGSFSSCPGSCTPCRLAVRSTYISRTSMERKMIIYKKKPTNIFTPSLVAVFL